MAVFVKRVARDIASPEDRFTLHGSVGSGHDPLHQLGHFSGMQRCGSRDEESGEKWANEFHDDILLRIKSSDLPGRR